MRFLIFIVTILAVLSLISFVGLVLWGICWVILQIVKGMQRSAQCFCETCRTCGPVEDHQKWSEPHG